MPDSILSDNGAQFAGFRHGFTQYEKWLMNNDILPIHKRVHHPQTQGKIERFHRSMKDELLKFETFADIAEAEKRFGEWREKYNCERPHEALKMRCPAEIYIPGERGYSGVVKPYEYGGEFHVVKVNSWGYVRFDRFRIYLSETMAGEYIEFRPNPLGGSLPLCYRNFAVAEFDTKSGKLTNRRISRL